MANKSENNKSTQRNLSIRSESVQRVYNFYKNELLIVNRRYQRKLIWTIEEKRAFIDSLMKNLPVPLILLAENTIQSKSTFEIIDGMQRLNAICSFIEGEFAYNDMYFDLDTMVESKSSFDEGLIQQNGPKLDRKLCENFSSYTLPLSIYTFNDPQKVDEIFIRVNSYGKHLSRQELRAAGTLENFGELVRVIASTIRTDVSHSNILNLRQMKEISITNTGLKYGINVDDVFWVANQIITKEMVRESRDEELVADLLSAIALPEIPASNSNLLDEYYGLKSSEKSLELDSALKRFGLESLREQFICIYNEIRQIINHANKNFRELIFKDYTQRIPRYFQTVFLALHKLIYKENLEVASYPELIRKLTNSAAKMSITDGGNWSATNRTENVDALAGIIRSSFKERTSNPANYKWVTELETLLMQSKTEQTSYDFKQGFTLLDSSKTFDENNFSKIIQTLLAIVNNSSNMVGYVCVGIAEKKKDATRINELHGVEPIKHKNFYITGIGHEAIILQKDLDNFFRFIVQKIKSQPISDEAKDMLARNVKLITYQDKDVVIFTAKSLAAPQHFNKKWYVRHGSSIEEVPAEQYSDFFLNYNAR